MYITMQKPFRILRNLVITLALLAMAIAPLRADDLMADAPKATKTTQLHYLPANRPDAIALLAPPPLAGSPEQAADLAETVAVHAQQTTAAQAAAAAEKKLTVFSFTPAVGNFFQPGKLPVTEEFLKNVREDTEIVEGGAKDFYKRPRPYTVDPSLGRGADDLEKSFSYPSGHSTRGTVWALVMAEMFPDKKDAILAVGRDIGWHRVEMARHYPSDIFAGRVLAQAIVRELKASPKFQSDLAKAQQEISAVLAGVPAATTTATASAH